jgi:hypothetical protein
MRLLQLLPRFRQARRELEALESREGWSRAQIEALQLERLNEVWAHANPPDPGREAPPGQLGPRSGVRTKGNGPAC